ncbi:phage tail length tape measure family protein [Sphingomonas paucimobilis]|uniref:phage tail length tape measure family protein n=1 Tax=Sphingomonas paucimobilis TaxID=13689 RepID=UPI00064BEA72|nr:phage tail length tape measure family protein [Sphingomonas paucimobilis]
MDDLENAALGVGFDIDTGGSFEALARLDTAIDRATANALEEFNRVERASASMLNLNGAQASLRTFGAETTQAARAAARELASVEKSGERLVAQVERQSAAFGKTREEMRLAKVEAAALAAEQQGLTELAGRLRASESELAGKELAAARRARFEAEALAEARAEAEAKAAIEAARERTRAEAALIVQLRERSQLQGLLDQNFGTNQPRATDAGATYSALAARAAEEEAQALRSAARAHEMFEARVKSGVLALREHEAAEIAATREHEMLAAAAERLRGSIDPAYAAQARFNKEIGDARKLISSGAIGLDEYAAKLRIEQALLDRATGAHDDLAQAQRLTAYETLNLTRNFADVGVTATMGMDPFMILVQQGPQILDVFQQVQARGGSAAGALRQLGQDVMAYAVAGFEKVATYLTPVNLLLAGTALVAVAAVRAMGDYGEAMRRLEITAAGLGRTSGQTAVQLEAMAETAASTGNRSLTAARDSVAAFASAGIESGQTITLLAANVDKYAKLTGQDAPAAQAALAEAMSDPARAADTFTQQLGLLNGAQYEHIRALAAQGDGEKAASELTRILTADIAANTHEATGLAHVMDGLGDAVAGVATMFGKLDQRIKAAGASYDAWLKRNVGGWAVDLIGTGNAMALGPNAAAGRNQDQIAALNASQSLNTSGMKQFNDLLAQQRILQKGLADTTGLTAAQVGALRHDYAAVTDTINANRTATGQWITTQDRAHMVAQAQAKLAAARNQTEKASAQQQLTRLQLGTQVLTQRERETQALDAYNRVADRYHKPKGEDHAAQLLRDAQAVEAQIRNLYALADAYAVSSSAALIAEARVRAESHAIRQRGDIEAAVNRQIELSIAQRVADGAKSVQSMDEQSRIQTEVNTAVANGLIPAARANELLRERMAELPLLAALEVAQQRGLAKGATDTQKALDALHDAQGRNRAAVIGSRFVATDEGADRRLAELAKEKELIEATDAARVKAMATLKAMQELPALDFGGKFATDYVAKQVQIAEGQQQLQALTNAYNESLQYQADLLDTIATNMQAAGRGMADAFGEAGRAIGDMSTVFAGHLADQQRLNDWQKQQLKNASELPESEARAAKERQIATQYALRSGAMQITMYGDLAASAKGFFAEGSTGYQAMATAEKAFRAVQFALSVRSIAQDAIETGSSIAKSGARAAAHAVEAVAKAIAGLPFPLNIAAGAATAGVLASIGLSIVGAFRGNGGELPKANDGTGTVLGDSAAKSESLKRSLDALKEVDTITSVYAREMATSLRSIDNQIGGLASVLVRAGNINASAGITEGFKTDSTGGLLKGIVTGGGLFSKVPVIGGIIGAVGDLIGSLFGSTTTVVGNGLYGGAQSLGGILSGGFDASYYSDVEKKKRFLGITTGKSYSTQYTGADAGLENQFTLILREFNDAIVAAAGPLGAATGDIQNRLNGFVVDIGKIDLKGLTGTQIQEKLTAVFGAAADRMADTAFPGFQRFAKVGEGAFETLVRVASTVEAATNALNDLGGAAQALGIDAKMGLVGQFDSISAFSSATDAYFKAYYSKAEQSAAKTAQLGKVFDSLGLSMPASLSAFRSLVEAQNLSTTAGQATYATLLKLAPAFADLQTAMEGVKSAADIASERADLERKLLEVNGDTAAIRALDLAKLDESNRALQLQIWAIQDAQEAAKAADELRKAWTSVGDSIMDEVKRIRGLTDTGTSGGFASLLGQFNAANTAARGGDQDAAKLLPSLSQSLLTAAGNTATSRQELDRIRAQTAAQLEATWAAIQGRSTAPVSGAASTASGMTAIDYAQSVQQSTAAPANDDMVAELRSLRDEVAQLRRENTAGHAATAGNTGAIKKTLDTVTAPSGGAAVSVAGAA